MLTSCTSPPWPPGWARTPPDWPRTPLWPSSSPGASPRAQPPCNRRRGGGRPPKPGPGRGSRCCGSRRRGRAGDRGGKFCFYTSIGDFPRGSGAGANVYAHPYKRRTFGKYVLMKEAKDTGYYNRSHYTARTDCAFSLKMFFIYIRKKDRSPSRPSCAPPLP